MSEMSSDIIRNNGVNGAGTLCEGCLAVALWVSSAGLVIIKKLLKQDGLRGENVADIECYFLSRPFDEEGKPIREYRKHA